MMFLSEVRQSSAASEKLFLELMQLFLAARENNLENFLGIKGERDVNG